MMLIALALLATCAPQDAAATNEVEPIDAHSAHGAAFDVGPRQAPYLMDNPDRVDFPVSLTRGHEDLQAFVQQGIGQLHGFWFLEAERTFRYVLAEDPDCAMGYWGLAMASVDQPERAAWFARAAWLKRGLVTKRERMYIDMMARFHSVDGPDEPKDLREPRNPAPGEEEDPDAKEQVKRDPPSKSDAARLVTDYEELIWAYPDDIEAKAMLVNRLWLNRRKGLPTTSRMAVEALLQEIFAVEPMHPAHHYRIHLWDAKDSAEYVVDSAVRSGLAWPNIAHMWHMGGHVFARLGRHHDAAWQQEASARVDHAHMTRNWILPDEIHNFAHNNEWLTRSLRHQGRLTESVELAKNMIELPRHPALNTLEKPRTSSVYGRLRLLEGLTLFEQWEELRRLGGTMYLEPHVTDAEGAARAYAMGQAAASLGDEDGLAAALGELELMIVSLRAERAQALDTAESKAIAADEKSEEVREAMSNAVKSFEREMRSMRNRIESLIALSDLLDDADDRDALKSLKDSGYERVHLARMLVDSGRRTDNRKLVKDAVKLARSAAKNANGQMLEHATLAYVLWTADEQEEALEVFEDLREGAALAELELPAFQRLAPLAAELGLASDWRPELQPANDVGERIALETLGPRHWAPPTAPSWTLSDAYGVEHSLSDYRGRPVLVVYFLGFGCVHCVEQLQAIAPKAKLFADAGIEIVAIGLQTPEELAGSLGGSAAESGYPFPVLSDPSLDHFRAWRAFDDFEDIALHGTYLVDGAGRVRWIDISHLPFMDVDFLVDEFQRLLALPVRGDERSAAKSEQYSFSLTVGAMSADAGAERPAEVEIPASALKVSLVLETAPHCVNCIADLQRICSGLEGFVTLDAKPNDSHIDVTVDGELTDASEVLSALEAGGRPGHIE